MATKAQLIEKAKELGVDISTSSTKDEIQAAIEKAKVAAKEGEQKEGER